MHDAQPSPFGKFTEQSLTEYFQEGSFFLASLIYFYSVLSFKKSAPIAVLLGGFTLMACVREFDAFLDMYAYDGAWQTLVLIILVGVTYSTIKNRNHLSQLFRPYFSSYPFGLMISGMLVTFIYSRLFGETIMWKTVMEENYVRNVKNAVEESVELLGDSIILIASLEYAFWSRNRESENS